MKPVTDPALLAELNGQGVPGGKPVTDPALLAELNGPQPTVMQTVAASPVGRLIHDVAVEPLEGAVSTGLQAVFDSPLRSMFGLPLPHAPGIGQATQAYMHAVPEKAYSGALEAQRNRPGYAAARQAADAALRTIYPVAGLNGATIMQSDNKSGSVDQVGAPVFPAAAGLGALVGSGGSLDDSHAAADAQAAAQVEYQREHPLKSLIGNTLGGLLLMPSRAALSQAGGSSLFAPPVPKGIAPEEAAMTYVTRLMQSSPQAADAAGLRAAQAAAAGKPITSAEAIGKPAEVAVGALARREGTTADAMSGQMAARSASASQRILDDYAAASGIHPAAARGDLEAFVEQGQKAAKPVYEEAYRANQNIASPMLDRILETPAGKRALAEARVKMQNDMSLLGTPDADLMAQAAEGGTEIPSRGVASGMKLRVYDYVKRSLDDQISAAYRAGNKNDGDIVKDLKLKLVRELDKADVTAVAGPNSSKAGGGLYSQARAKAGEYLSAKKQFELAQSHILDDKFSARDMAGYFADLGASDRQAYLGGIANRLFNAQQAGRLKAGTFNAPVVQRKLATVMGEGRARDFLRNMATEKSMAGFAAKRTPAAGSPTAEYRAAMDDQDGAAATAFASHLFDVGEAGVTKGLTAAALQALKKGAGAAQARYLTGGMGPPVRDRAGQLLLMSPNELADMLKLPPPPLTGVTYHRPLPVGLLEAFSQREEQR